MGLFRLKTYILSKISHMWYHLEALKQYYLENHSLGIESYPEDRVSLDKFQQKIYQNVSFS